MGLWGAPYTVQFWLTPLTEKKQLPRDGGEGTEAKAEERGAGGHCQAPGGEGPEAAGNEHEGGEDRLLGGGLGDLGREPRLGHREWAWVS